MGKTRGRNWASAGNCAQGTESSCLRLIGFQAPWKTWEETLSDQAAGGAGLGRARERPTGSVGGCAGGGVAVLFPICLPSVPGRRQDSAWRGTKPDRGFNSVIYVSILRLPMAQA